MEENNLKNTTKYGEFVCSFYQWLPIDIQKEQTEKMSKITDKNYSDKYNNK